MDLCNYEIEFYDGKYNVLDIEKETKHKVLYCNTFADFKKALKVSGSFKMISTATSYRDLFLRLQSGRRALIGNEKLYDKSNYEDLDYARNSLEFDSVTGYQKDSKATKMVVYYGYADGTEAHAFVKTACLRFADIHRTAIINSYNLAEYFVIFKYEDAHWIYAQGQY